MTPSRSATARRRPAPTRPWDGCRGTATVRPPTFTSRARTDGAAGASTSENKASTDVPSARASRSAVSVAGTDRPASIAAYACRDSPTADASAVAVQPADARRARRRVLKPRWESGFMGGA